MACTSLGQTSLSVSDARASQRAGTKLVDVYYDLVGGVPPYAVSIEGSSDGGATWTLPVTSVSGHVGSVSTAGNNRVVTWDAGVDWNGQISNVVRFRVNVMDSAVPPVPEGFASIPGGTFAMGDAFEEGNDRERPVHNVTLSPFYIQRTEVTSNQVVDVFNLALTQGKVTATAGAVSLSPPLSRELLQLSTAQISWNSGTQQLELQASKSDGYPCVGITWYGAAAYCNYLSEMEGFQPCYAISGAGNWGCDFSKNGYRLPTEAEWEYAARGGLADKRFPLGDTISHAQANYRAYPESYTYDVSLTTNYHPDFKDSNPFLAPANDLVTNGYGLYHMAGNVSELVNDFFHPDSYQLSSSLNPTGSGSASGGGSAGYRVVRGGHWNLTAPSSRVAFRDNFSPQGKSAFTGFRPVRRPVAP